MLKKCSGCKNLFKPLSKNKTCIGCQKRSRENRIELYKNCIRCKATIGKTTKRCTYKCLENDEYCGKHQNNKKYNNLIKSGKRICKDWKVRFFRSLDNPRPFFYSCIIQVNRRVASTRPPIAAPPPVPAPASAPHAGLWRALSYTPPPRAARPAFHSGGPPGRRSCC